LNALVNSDIVPNLCPPPDPKLFPQGIDTAWCKPGRAVWQYLDGGPTGYEGEKEFTRLAGELGFEYNVIEGLWRRWTDEQIRELVDYGRQRGVGLWVWVSSKSMRDPKMRHEMLTHCHDLGIVGLKIDFFDHEAKEIIDLYQALLKEGAEKQLLFDFHGANKPTGEQRTWPNELTREAVRGMEARSMTERAVHETTLPFTRFLVGPAEYTPVIFGERKGDTTWAHQAAVPAVFTTPLLTYGCNPQTMLESPCGPMLKSIPATWDETIVLPESKIGELAAFARRHGDMWFLAVLNGPAGRQLTVPLKFLGEGKYQTLMIRDQQDKPEAVRIENAELGPADKVEIDMPHGGGFIARFTKQ
jgi:alpha-glucosidase